MPGVTHRLSPEAYAQLEKQLPNLIVQKDTTDVQAGYLLGIQKVLELLRNGFTVGA